MTNKASEVFGVANYFPIHDQYVVVSPSGMLYGGYDGVPSPGSAPGWSVYMVTFREVYTTENQFFPQTEDTPDYSNERG